MINGENRVSGRDSGGGAPQSASTTSGRSMDCRSLTAAHEAVARRNDEVAAELKKTLKGVVSGRGLGNWSKAQQAVLEFPNLMDALTPSRGTALAAIVSLEEIVVRVSHTLAASSERRERMELLRPRLDALDIHQFSELLSDASSKDQKVKNLKEDPHMRELLSQFNGSEERQKADSSIKKFWVRFLLADELISPPLHSAFRKFFDDTYKAEIHSIDAAKETIERTKELLAVRRAELHKAIDCVFPLPQCGSAEELMRVAVGSRRAVKALERLAKFAQNLTDVTPFLSPVELPSLHAARVELEKAQRAHLVAETKERNLKQEIKSLERSKESSRSETASGVDTAAELIAERRAVSERVERLRERVRKAEAAFQEESDREALRNKIRANHDLVRGVHSLAQGIVGTELGEALFQPEQATAILNIIQSYPSSERIHSAIKAWINQAPLQTEGLSKYRKTGGQAVTFELSCFFAPHYKFDGMQIPVSNESIEGKEGIFDGRIPARLMARRIQTDSKGSSVFFREPHPQPGISEWGDGHAIYDVDFGNWYSTRDLYWMPIPEKVDMKPLREALSIFVDLARCEKTLGKDSISVNVYATVV